MRRVQSDGQGATAAVDELLEWVEQPDSTEADSFLLDADPSTKLLFAKTSMTPPTTSTALAYRVVTSVRVGRSAYRQDNPPSTTSIDRSPAYDSPSASPSDSPSRKRRRSLVLQPDRPSSADPASLIPSQTDCQYLLDHTDWSKTSLGPRSTWSPVIEAMINTVMYSKTQDALWLGPEFNMI
jgi:hypothetical protein